MVLIALNLAEFCTRILLLRLACIELANDNVKGTNVFRCRLTLAPAAADMQKRLDALGKPTPDGMGLRIKGARWSKAELRVDVNYRATTREGLLRHASFKGLSED